MHRAILLAWLPWFGCLLAAVAALWLVMRFSGARPALAKVRRLHRCEAGSVQTLSFVLTLPLFIMLLMFIVQVADLMVAIGIIHYSAYAAARSAVVWLPANVVTSSVTEAPNALDPDSVLDGGNFGRFPQWKTNRKQFDFAPGRNWKYSKIWMSAMLACAPMSPAYDLAMPSKQPAVVQAVGTVYPNLVPSSQQYPRIQALIAKKLSYSARNTAIELTGIDRDATGFDESGNPRPTYNPYPGHYVQERDPATGLMVDVWVDWNPSEIGWEDPVTVTVFHKYALMPGPGRFLATVLASPDGTPDRVSPFVQRSSDESYQSDGQKIRLYFVMLTASVTLSNEGLKSVMPYVPPAD